MSIDKLDLFEDIAVSMESWIKATSEALENPDAELIWVDEKEPYERIQRAIANAGISDSDLKCVISECLRGFAVSILTMIDGGTELSEKGQVYLVDSDGNSFGDGLHDAFIMYLINTGRLK